MSRCSRERGRHHVPRSWRASPSSDSTWTEQRRSPVAELGLAEPHPDDPYADWAAFVAQRLPRRGTLGAATT